MQRLLATALLLAFLCRPVMAEDSGLPSRRLFVCAHSFMIFTGDMLKPMVQAAGVPHVDAGQQMIGGSRVIQHWELPDGRNKAKAALRAGKVDVLTLSPHVQIPDPGIDNFAKLGFEKNPNLRVLVQASWPAFDDMSGSPKGRVDRNAATLESLRELRRVQNTTWRKQLETQVQALNESLGAPVAAIIPVNDAVFALREHIVEGKAPGLSRQSDLFTDEIGHPKPPLSLLVTYCHFAAIHRRSPVGLPVPEPYRAVPRAAELNLLLQQLAWEAVSAYQLDTAKAR
jgi:hypothetical protein